MLTVLIYNGANTDLPEAAASAWRGPGQWNEAVLLVKRQVAVSCAPA